MTTDAPRTGQPAPSQLRTRGGFTAFGVTAEGERLAPGLHIVATPIGNLRDISFRALGTLAGADAILAEDTRVTRTLLTHFGIATPLVAYHEHNAALMRPKVMERLRQGHALALVSDAGTPLVSDPGYKLVEGAVEAGFTVTGVPGPSAVMAALVLAGLPTDRFFFEGFLPPKAAARRARLQELATIPGTLVFFESPRRVAEALADASAMLGPRPAAVARELTKFYEQVRRGTLSELASLYATEDAPRGEVVILIGAAQVAEQGADEIGAAADEAIDARLKAALATLSLKEAVAQVTAATGQPRRKIYARALELTRQP